MTKLSRNFAIASVVVFILSCIATASDVKLTADPSVPAAGGKAHLSKDKNGNLKLKIEVYTSPNQARLPPRSRITWCGHKAGERIPRIRACSR